MRYALAVVLLATASFDAAAQTVGHEYRPELVLTSPRVGGYALQLLWEQHLETDDLGPVEKTLGVGISGPVAFHVRPVLEVREVKQPGIEEHRYIPSLFYTIPLANKFELRNRTRVEIRDIGGKWSERWQDRTAFGRDIDIAGVKSFTYIQGDAYYDSRYSTFNRLDKTVGVRVPITSGSSIDTFFSRIDDTRKAQRTTYYTSALLRVSL